GHIAFLNCVPLYWGLMNGGGLDPLTLRQDTPDQLNDALLAGDLDVSPISVVPYLQHADELVPLDIAVGSDGPVLSVVLVSKRPLAELDSRTVALGATSRTGVALAQLLLEERYRVHPSYETMAPDLDAMLAVADAAVLIGDVALRATADAGRHTDVTVHDLAAEWRDWTGLPMVFAVWAARREYADAHPDEVRAIRDAFAASRALVAANIERVATEVAAGSRFTAEELTRYFTVLDFSFGPRQREGMAEFARRLRGRGVLGPEPAA
ncbi:MAG: chorismate dehydratase, partial [Frankiaceae bacterium]|nr:chorismate dehydratase [Frankiaceae bacterium]